MFLPLSGIDSLNPGREKHLTYQLNHNCTHGSHILYNQLPQETVSNLPVQPSTKIFHTGMNTVSNNFEFTFPLPVLCAIYSISPVFLSEACAIAPVVFASPPSAFPFRDADPPAPLSWPHCRPESPDQIPPSDCWLTFLWTRGPFKNRLSLVRRSLIIKKDIKTITVFKSLNKFCHWG